MTSSDQAKGTPGGAKTSRSETVTVRLNPRAKYLAELAARAQRRTLSSFIEEQVEAAVRKVVVPLGDKYAVVDLVQEALWDVNEMDRLGNLARSFPELMTDEEQQLWRMVSEVLELMNHSFNSTLLQRSYLRRYEWVFRAAVKHGLQPSEVVDALRGKGEVTELLSSELGAATSKDRAALLADMVESSDYFASRGKKPQVRE